MRTRVEKQASQIHQLKPVLTMKPVTEVKKNGKNVSRANFREKFTLFISTPYLHFMKLRTSSRIDPAVLWQEVALVYPSTIDLDNATLAVSAQSARNELVNAWLITASFRFQLTDPGEQSINRQVGKAEVPVIEFSLCGFYVGFKLF